MYKKALPPLVDNSSQILIMGTMPGDQSIAKQEYYGNRGNHFWKIIFSVFEEEFSTLYEDRKALLQRNRIALWNVLASCIREGSSDSKIKEETVNDFVHFHKQYPNIKYVFFESKAAAKIYQKYVTAIPELEYYTLPSTSGLNAGISLNEKMEMWKILAQTAKKLK